MLSLIESEVFSLGKDTKQKIITLTLQEIAAGNYATLSLRKISKKIGLTTGAFYKHFSNKTQLLTVAANQLNSDLVGEVRQTDILKQQEPEKSLIALGKFLIGKIEHDKASMDFLFFETKSSYETLIATSPLFSVTIEIIDKIIKNQKKEELAGKIFYREWSFILGYGLLLKNNVTPYDDQFFENTVLTLLYEA